MKLCSPKVAFNWTDECQNASLCAKSLLCSAPILSTLTWIVRLSLKWLPARPESELSCFRIVLTGYLIQCYFSVTFNSHQMNYSTIEKETLAMLLALQHFNVYVSYSTAPVIVYTEPNPLVFLKKM